MVWPSRFIAPSDTGKLSRIIFIDWHHKESIYSISGCGEHIGGQRLCWFIPRKIPHLVQQLRLSSLLITFVIIHVILQDPSGFSTRQRDKLDGGRENRNPHLYFVTSPWRRNLCYSSRSSDLLSWGWGHFQELPFGPFFLTVLTPKVRRRTRGFRQAVHVCAASRTSAIAIRRAHGLTGPPVKKACAANLPITCCLEPPFGRQATVLVCVSGVQCPFRDLIQLLPENQIAPVPQCAVSRWQIAGLPGGTASVCLADECQGFSKHLVMAARCKSPHWVVGL